MTGTWLYLHKLRLFLSNLMVKDTAVYNKTESVKAENGVADTKSNVLLATVVSLLPIQV